VSDDEDRDREARAFREAMRGVRRLPRGGKAERAAPKPPAKARFTRADQVEVLRESLLPPPDEAVLATGDELSFRRPHISEAVLTRLRRGAYVVDGEIDLHGMTGAEAKAALRTFIAECIQQRVRCVRVVHGKGRRSGPRGPVLKNVVNHWLQRADDVLAFGSARAVDGGSGAIYVLLRSK
jgi:DNA-nicking Smr family endonuclease